MSESDPRSPGPGADGPTVDDPDDGLTDPDAHDPDAAEDYAESVGTDPTQDEIARYGELEGGDVLAPVTDPDAPGA